MKEIEDTSCEARKITEFHIPNWNASVDDCERPSTGSSDSSEMLGGFIDDGNYAWLSSGPKLIVINTKTGVNISSWLFRERISTVSAFPAPAGEIPLLLIGLDNEGSKIRESAGMICIFDCTISQVVWAIRMPAGVEQCCVVTGGEESLEKPEERPLEHDGLACVALRNLDYLLVDLKQDSWSNAIDRAACDELNPAEIADKASKTPSGRSRARERHSAHNLMSRSIEKYIGFDRELFESSPLPASALTTALIYSKKIRSLISGCQSRIMMWHSSGALRWISPGLPDSAVIRHFALLEPTDDPRPFCYLWAASDTKKSRSLRMYAMLFEQKHSDKTANYYSNLEGEPSVKFELELGSKSRVRNLIPILRETNQDQTDNKRGEDNLLLISTCKKTLLFDLNQWYKEQMPRFLDDCANHEAIFTSYPTNPDLETRIISSAYLPATLREFQSSGATTPEEYFHPNSLSLEWSELSSSRVVIWQTRGVQGHLLREISLNGPVILHDPSKIFHECLAAGLIPRETPQAATESQKRDALLSLCLEQRWTTYLLRCAHDWSDGSAAYLFPEFLRWAIARASTIRVTTHQLCIPLFDQSGATIGEADVRTLRFLSQQMGCLCTVMENLMNHSSDLEQQKRTLRRISTYLQVLLWFYDVGLLPETQEDVLGLSFILKIPYPAQKLAAIYAEKRQQRQELFIDELITRECPALTSQWEEEASEPDSEGLYPPPSLQSLLRSCLIDCHYPDCHEMETKHQIIIYLLMDLVMMLQGSCPGVDQLIKYPSAFKLSPSVIKLTHALWFLDHENFQGFLDTMSGQLVSEADIKDWHHQFIMRTLLRSGQNKIALVYLRIRKPPLSSIDEQAAAVNLAVEHGLVQSAFHRRPPTHYSQLLSRFFHACKAHGKLNDVLQLTLSPEEEEAFVQFLEAEKCEETKLIYYLQRCRWNEAGKMPLSHAKSSSFAVFKAYNATLPAISQRMSASGSRKIGETLSNHIRPMSHAKNRVKPHEIMEMVMKKARETFERNDRAHIPFVSAPCLSLRGNNEILDKNSVLYVDRVEKSGKRVQEDDFQMRKRRKIDDEVNFKADVTPLVKRKHFLIENQVETPHSILKIRQMIRDSVEKNDDEKILGKKIRFSITQPKFPDSPAEGSVMDQDDLREIDSRSNTPACETSDQDSNEFYSPNASLASVEATALLSDDSSVTKSILGPRPRAGLKRSIFGEILGASTPAIVDKNHSKLENTAMDTSCINSSPFPDTSRLLNIEESLNPMYSSTILSSDSSYELSRAAIERNSDGFSRKKLTKISETSGDDFGRSLDVKEEIISSSQSNSSEKLDVMDELNQENEGTEMEFTHQNDQDTEIAGRSVEHSDESENELDELKYEEADDDVFKSLSNSMEISNSRKQSLINELKNSENSNLQEEMTDDESLINFDEKKNPENFLEKSMIHDENITDDETMDSLDVEKSQKSSPVKEFQPKTPDDLEKSSKSKVKRESSEKSMISSGEILADVENSTPGRMTRSRRASSVTPLPLEPRRSQRATSLVQEIKSTPEDNASPAKRKRGRPPSLIKEVLTPTVRAEVNSEEVPTRRVTRRAASVQKEMQESRSEDPSGCKPVQDARKTRAASLSSDFVTVRTSTRTRAASESKDLSVKAPAKRMRVASAAKDAVEEESAANRKQRAGSVPKKSVDKDESLPRRSTRTSSQPRELPSQKETTRRVTRQRAAEGFKEKSSILTDVIPEEAIFDGKPGKRAEKSTSEDLSEGKKTRGRKTRASSVDCTVGESSRRTRSRNSVEPAGNLSETCDIDGKKTRQTRKRAVSETKDVGSLKNSTKIKRTTKIKDQEDFSPEETRGAPEDDEKDNEFIFSPPHTRLTRTVMNQPRR